MSKVKWGILSTANIGQTQVIPAINRSKLGEAIAIASLSGRAQEAADKLGIPKVYESYEALLSDEEIDAVYIPLPNHLHAKWVMEAAKAGKHVLVEKPASLTAHEMEEMLDVCNRHGVIFMEAFMYQFHAQHKRVRDILKTGEIGEVKYMYASHSFFLDDEENIRLSPEKGGGALYDVGCYNIHAFRHILQAEPKEVRVFSKMNNPYHIDMTTTGHLWMDNGVQAMFDCSFEMKTRDEYRVVGTKGEIICQHAYRPDRKDHKGTLIIKTNEETRKEIISCDQYLMQVEHFAECVIEGKQPQYTGTDTLQNMKVIDACYESIRTNQTVTLL
ncbi:Gfo/Idh/MocA family protein [Pradoshia sp.]|uniref:Gfo/Idh/MocA family protein n=1 Tax=Pradoshia sp. TaxID=2651281 RepID=UPI003F0CBAEE